MGCGDSSTVMNRPLQSNQKNFQNYNNNSTMFYQMQNAKRPKFLNPQLLNQIQRDTLWAIIQRNSLKQFAYFIQNQGIPNNIEVGPANTFWNFAHFCARWDAFQCLSYIIKRNYAQGSTLHLSLMNQQTIQGFTAIHIAIEWNAINCFNLLIDCGGVDLSYTDKSNNDVFAKASLFKRQQMLQILERFRSGNALMILAQPENLRGFQSFSQLVASGQIQTKSQYKISNERINQVIDTRNRLNRPPPPPPPPIENTNKYQDFYNNMKTIQSQKNGRTSSESSVGQQQQVNIKKLQQQRKFQEDQARIKRQQTDNLKRAIQIQKQEEQKRLNQEINKQISIERAFQQAQLAKIQKQKQIMRQNIEAMHSNPYQVQGNFSKNTKQICPKDIRPIYQAALSRQTKFVDNQFPADIRSLGDVSKFKFGWDDCVWLRPEQMFLGGRFQVFDGISPEDVKQGTLGVCYYLALLASIAEYQERIKKIFKFYDQQLGFYALQLYLEGKPITVIVDDLIPCMKGTYQPLFAKPRGAEIWVMIFQKAWVKMFGNYLAAEKMATSDMFQNVLPSPCKTMMIDISKIDQQFDTLIEYDQKKYIMVSSSSGGTTPPPGIVQQHAYSLIGAHNINGAKICKIRNPWGKTQFAGMYSQQSSLWTLQLQSALNFQRGDDGIFYLTPTQLQSIMPFVSISCYRDNYFYSHIQITSKSNEDLFYVINVKQKSQLAIKVTQQNQRFRKNMQFQNSAIRIEVCKIIADTYDAKIIMDGQPSSVHYGAANLFATENVYQAFQPGRYLIKLKVLYDRTHSVSTRGTYRKFIRGTDGKNPLIVRQGKCVLSIYGPEPYAFNKLNTDEGFKYMKNVYKNQILESKQTKERMKSVGQDLKPTVIAKDCKMRNQLIYFAENLLPSHSINFSFKFQHDKFRNCSYAFNVNKQSESCDWVLKPGEWNLATLEIDCPFQQIATDGLLKTDFKIIR